MADDMQSTPPQNDTDSDGDHNDSPEPLVNLPPVELKTLEEDEELLLRIRAKLYRYDTDPDRSEWKERGVGYCHILKHKQTGFIRILMRRDKTLKICANHYINPGMELKANCESERAWMWVTSADFADEVSKVELLAIRFGNVDNAQKFKTVFDESRAAMKQLMEKNVVGKVSNSDNSESDGNTKQILTQLKDMAIKEDSTGTEQKDESVKEENTQPKDASVKEG